MSDKRGRAGVRQGGQTFSVTGRYLPGHYLLSAPIRNRAGQGRARQGQGNSYRQGQGREGRQGQARPGQAKRLGKF